MPRRGGRDRYRTLTQARAAKDYTPPRTHPIVLQPALAAALTNGKHVQNARLGLLCRCGLPWTACTSCSKPVQR